MAFEPVWVILYLEDKKLHTLYIYITLFVQFLLSYLHTVIY